MAAKHPKPHESSKSRTPGRRAGSDVPPGDRWRVRAVSDAPVGPGVVTAPLGEVLAAITALPATLDWDSLGVDVLPVLPRVRLPIPGSPTPIQVMVPPGIPVRFGVDRGPMFLTVHQGLLDDWEMDAAQLLGAALHNLGRRTAHLTPRDVVSQRVDRVVVRALQSGESSGSALVLLPEVLARVFGPQPQLFVAPMRDLLMSLPLDVDRGLAYDLYEVFAIQDPNCLPPMAFPFANGRLSVEALAPDGIGLPATPWPLAN